MMTLSMVLMTVLAVLLIFRCDYLRKKADRLDKKADRLDKECNERTDTVSMMRYELECNKALVETKNRQLSSAVRQRDQARSAHTAEATKRRKAEAEIHKILMALKTENRRVGEITKAAQDAWDLGKRDYRPKPKPTAKVKFKPFKSGNEIRIMPFTMRRSEAQERMDKILVAELAAMTGIPVGLLKETITTRPVS